MRGRGYLTVFVALMIVIPVIHVEAVGEHAKEEKSLSNIIGVRLDTSLIELKRLIIKDAIKKGASRETLEMINRLFKKIERDGFSGKTTIGELIRKKILSERLLAKHITSESKAEFIGGASGIFRVNIPGFILGLLLLPWLLFYPPFYPLALLLLIKTFVKILPLSPTFSFYEGICPWCPVVWWYYENGSTSVYHGSRIDKYEGRQCGITLRGFGHVEIHPGHSMTFDLAGWPLIIYIEGECKKTIASSSPSIHSLVKSTHHTPHEPIQINGNDEFTPENGVVRGSGSPDDPYVIENWIINASSSTGIEIRNTDAFFVIKNCYIFGNRANNGITLVNVKNGAIERCILTDCYYGLFLKNSENIVVNNITFTRNLRGSRSFQSRDIIFSNCTISKCLDVGLDIIGGNNFDLVNLTCSQNGDGIYMYHSTNNRIDRCRCINNTFFGIFLWSSPSRVTSTVCEGNYVGLEAFFTWTVTIEKSNIVKNSWGLEFYYAFGKANYNDISENQKAGLTATLSIVDARYNWWGSANGPSGKAPGDGDRVWWTVGVVKFKPWLNMPP